VAVGLFYLAASLPDNSQLFFKVIPGCDASLKGFVAGTPEGGVLAIF